MVTQSLRGLANHGPMHWRGDANGGTDQPTAQPDSGAFDEHAAFLKLNAKFQNVLGRDQTLTGKEITAFASFILQLSYPPNPDRNLDNSLTPDQAAGLEAFSNLASFTSPTSATAFSCASCHRLDPQGNAEFGVAAPGFFGTDGF